jgi:hypothetical protein
MCKNMTRTSIFNLTSMDIDMLRDTSRGNDRKSEGFCTSSLQVFPLNPFEVALKTTN